MYTYTHVEWNIIQPLKKKETPPFATPWTKPEDIVPSEISQREKDKHRTVSLMCRI